jgi:hypothetical protein
MAPPIQVIRLVNSRGEARQRKTVGFNEYIPSTSAPTVHERVKFTSQPQGPSATLKNIVRPQRLEQRAAPSESLSDRNDFSNVVPQDDYHMTMEEDIFADEELGSQNKRRRTAGVSTMT